MAAIRSREPAPHREIDRTACVNGTSRGCTRVCVRMYTAPANGVGTDGTNTVYCPSALFDDEPRHQGLLDLDQRRFPGALAALTRQALREAANALAARPVRVVTAAPTMKQTSTITTSDRRSCVAIPPGMSAATGLTRPVADCML